MSDDAVARRHRGQFRKGESGNPRGRPRGQRRTGLPFDDVLGKLVTIRADGGERRVTAAEAFMLHLTSKGLDGDGGATQLALVAIEEARAARRARTGDGRRITRIVKQIVMPGFVNDELRRLKMAVKLDPYGAGARMELEPWLVQAALARLGDHVLSAEEQSAVVAATRTPGKVRWPGWWTVLP